MDVTPQLLYAALILSWDARTAFGEWDEYEPSLNQCTPTAMVVQDYLGGYILTCELTDGDRHFWNKLPDAREVDFTAAQLYWTRQEVMPGTIRTRSKKSLFRTKHVAWRYKILAERVASVLARFESLDAVHST